VSGLGTAFLSGGLLGRFVSLLYMLAFRKAAVVYFQNVEDRNLFVGDRLVRADQARLLPGSGINLKRFAMTALPLGAHIRFLMVARLLGDKGVREYVEAARIARRIVPEARFGLLGAIDDGNRTAISADELAEWVREGVIDYLGEVSDVRPQLAEATVIVLPSYREGLPRSLLEGAAMGRPLIATDVPGCRELVEDGVNGFLCRARDRDSLSAAMIRMATLDEGVRAKMGARSRQLAEERFNEELVTKAYVMALAELEGRGTVRS
jgi:glycosyltransferase involved in cell wall biosynthesis